jgi:hypothetical protein
MRIVSLEENIFTKSGRKKGGARWGCLCYTVCVAFPRSQKNMDQKRRIYKDLKGFKKIK